MGRYLLDRYSLLHIMWGMIANLFGIPLLEWIILHIIFEITENHPIGMFVINNGFGSLWPGGKPEADTLINSVGDTLCAIIGWYVVKIVR